MQFLKPHHYAAFEDPKPNLDDPPTVRERISVREALLQLDEVLWPFISRSGWDLHRHRHKTHYVSSDHFITLPAGCGVYRPNDFESCDGNFPAPRYRER